MVTLPRGDEALVALVLVLACLAIASLLRWLWRLPRSHEQPNGIPVAGEAAASGVDLEAQVVRSFRPARDGQLAKTFVVLVLVAAAAGGILFLTQPRTEPAVQSALAYYQQARPILDRQADEFEKPFQTLYFESLPALSRGDPAAWQRFVAETKRLQPHIVGALRDLEGLSAPGGRASDLHSKVTLAWRSQRDAAVSLVEGWEAADFKRVEAGLDNFARSEALLQDSQVARAEFESWLSANTRE